MNQPTVSPDTAAVLLLCGRFGGERQEEFSPLTTREYGELAKWLNSKGLRPSDLIVNGAAVDLSDLRGTRIERERVESLLERGAAMALALERWSRGGIWVISRGDPEFPWRLKRRLKQAAPPLLYGAGDAGLLDVGGLAIVGSRDATEQGLRFARDVASRCASEAICVVSGGARGVDEAAMQAVIDAGGYGIGVLANDLLRSTLSRRHRIPVQEGRLVLVSSFYPEAAFHAGAAMGRNKFIYALADRALVIDTDKGRGGTWEGATENLAQQWVPLFVRIPGDGTGNAALVEAGAQPFDFDPLEGMSLGRFLETAEPASAARGNEIQASLLPDKYSAVDMALERSADLQGGVGDALAMAQDQDPPLDLYEAFLRCLRVRLVESEQSEEALAAELFLEKTQAKVWLKRAMEEGRVRKSGRPARYAWIN